ncbi:MAG: hypothetical protein ACLFOC_03780 [Campylobacterales bacterium]
MVKKLPYAYVNSSSYVVTDNYSDSYHVILSPNFYYYFKEMIPVLSTQKAKKLAPSVLQGRVPAGIQDYFVFKTAEKNVYDIIVFDQDSFESKLESSGFPKEKIKSISFASVELDKDFRFYEDGRLIVKEGDFFFDLPSSVSEESQSIQNGLKGVLEQKKESKFKLIYGARDFKELIVDNLEENYKVAVSFVLFVSILFVLEGVAYIDGAMKFQDRYEKLGDLAKKSSLELEYMKRDLDSEYEKQLEIKRGFDRISEIKGIEKANVKELRLNSEGLWEVVFEADNKDSVDKLLSNIKSEFKQSREGSFVYELEL